MAGTSRRPRRGRGCRHRGCPSRLAVPVCNATAVSYATLPTVGLPRLQLQVDFWMAGVRESTTCSPPAIQLVEVWGTHPPFYFTPRPPHSLMSCGRHSEIQGLPSCEAEEPLLLVRRSPPWRGLSVAFVRCESSTRQAYINYQLLFRCS